jgi:hypothetical protein
MIALLTNEGTCQYYIYGLKCQYWYQLFEYEKEGSMQSGILIWTLSHFLNTSLPVLSAFENENDFLHRIVCT